MLNSFGCIVSLWPPIWNSWSLQLYAIKIATRHFCIPNTLFENTCLLLKYSRNVEKGVLSSKLCGLAGCDKKFIIFPKLDLYCFRQFSSFRAFVANLLAFPERSDEAQLVQYYMNRKEYIMQSMYIGCPNKKRIIFPNPMTILLHQTATRVIFAQPYSTT